MTDAQQESLDILQEECGELVVIISKVKRFGLMSENPEQPGVTARQRLLQEIGDVFALADLVCRYHNIGTLEIEFAKQRKFDKLKIYSKHLRDIP
jgi:NTP pyrophosphatase (non-canonical NTP hydrolase)